MIKNLIKEGFALKNKGYYKHAIEVFYKALEEDNTSSELLLEIADLYYILGNEEHALNYIEQILSLNPTHTDALKLLKKIFITKNALPEAEQTAKNIYCITHNIKDAAEIFRLLNLQHKYDEIFEYNIETDDCDICIEKARAHYYKKEYEQAKDLLNNVLHRFPDNQTSLLLLGEVYYAQNQKDACIDLLDKFDYSSNNSELFNFTGLIKLYQGLYREALKNFKNAIRLDHTNSLYYFNLANTYFSFGDTRNAKYYYNLAINLSPENPNYHFALANLYYSEKHYKKALEELDGSMFEARLLRTIILYETGYLALANKELTSLLEEQPDNNLVQSYKTKIENELGLSKKL